MTKNLLISAIVAITLFACNKNDDPQATDPIVIKQNDIAALDTKVADFMSKYSIPGASLAVSKNGKLVYSKGYGFADQATNEKVTASHRFRLASVSKTFTGAAIMKLVQDGKLTLDSKVFGTGALLGTEYGTPPYNAQLSAMTVRHLLQHISGSWGGSTGGDVIDYNPEYNTKQLLDWVLNTRTNPKEPGTFYDYSNVGFWIAGRIVEKVSGKSYVEYVKSILAPAGVTQIDIAGKTEAERKTNEVKYYGQEGDAPYEYVIAFPRRDSDGGLISTAPDLLRFITAIDGFSGRADILNQASLDAMTTAPSFNPFYACGIGIWDDQNLWYNYGSLPGTRTGFMRHDNGMCVALLLNSRVDPLTGETEFAQAMQNVMLDIVKNTVYPWQDIDQF